MLSLYEEQSDNLQWREQHLYGSSRLGIWRIDTVPTAADLWQISNYANRRQYELSNHLGNVMAVVGDYVTVENDTIKFPSVFSLNDYYVFGVTKRWSGSEGYRYGFNGQQKSTEINTEGNSYTAEFWQYDARLGRRWNVDPVTVVGLSDYSSFSGNPILKSDPDGDCAECPKKGAPAGTQHTERGPAGMTPVGGMVFAGKKI